ncbi:MAG: tetratricopeptide repeat-containing diguanylate cyclase, partial [Clostridium sp.]
NVADSALLPLGTANIYLGEYTEALEQIQRAEKVYIDINDSPSLASTYYSYGEYYNATGDLALALEYYDKSIDLYYEMGKYIELKPILEKTIDFIKLNNLDKDPNININSYYSMDYVVSNKADDDKTLNEILSHIISINVKIGDSQIHFLEKQNSRNNIIILLAAMVILLLAVLVNRNIKSKKTLETLANKDFLTGLNNRSYGERLIHEKIKENMKLSIGIIDIDNFKYINDSYGHVFGDYILKEVSLLIKQNVDENDIIFRFGGEEFVIAFVNKSKVESKQILDNIRILISEKTFDKNINVTFSGGISQLNDATLNQVIKDADELLYKAKHEGKNKVL